MIHQRNTRSSYQFVLDRMCKKLSGWKANFLSFASRITLAQASLSSIPGYVLQTSPIPVSVCNEAEKLCRDFIWGSTADARKCHLVAWDKICAPKEDGGLGFRNLQTLNKAHMMKLSWSLITDRNKLWVQVMKAKYSCGPNLVPEVRSKGWVSHIWRAVVDIWDVVLHNISWVIQDGKGTRFWRDSWIPGMGALCEEPSVSVLRLRLASLFPIILTGTLGIGLDCETFSLMPSVNEWQCSSLPRRVSLTSLAGT